ncbi:hypothetical protein [Croceicoccus bisphenolivorans]|uniref:hypothetical protein n=1 Tax=Croceicoccus bisphenolivorans TaxID=1783232 RepID=UPI0009EDBD2B|nr:hypothetical protein [Croceicoccus bisphenolivorans]
MQRSKISHGIAIIALAALCGCTSEAEEPAKVTATDDAAMEVAEPAADPDYVPAQQVADIPIEHVGFEDGSNSTTVEGSITGYESIDYVFRAKQGQPLNISMATPHTATYFNLIEPGETDVAIFNGSMGENMFEGAAAKSGDYRVRVYMMRSAARREETADYRLEINVG